MVTEREPPTGSAPLQQSSDKHLNARIENVSSTPEFGKTSPLKNPLRKETNVFNIPAASKPRPEHHRDVVKPSWREVYGTKAAAAESGSQNEGDLDLMEIPRPSNFKPPPTLDAVSITTPSNPPNYNTYKTQSSYSTGTDPTTYTWQQQYPHLAAQQANRSGFTTVNTGGSFEARNAVDLTIRDNDDHFDPNAALRANSFGAPDPYSYVDPNKANENLKALLEGAFEDDEELPRTRLRSRRAAPKKVQNAATALADRLAALEVKENETKAEEVDDDEDDGSVDGLKVKLLPHQVEGVSWMLDRESGQRKNNGVLPKGGILADDMGLGKTIQALALILTNPRPEESELARDPKRAISKEVGHGTLVVAPLALIKQWEAEIKSKVTRDHELKVLVHHGPSRTKRAADLRKYDVVITTYQVMASEHANSSDDPKGIQFGCYGVHWYRLILDEAHTIKNRNAKMTQACYALRSCFRWCLTGTPMQNNLDELQSLIRFLQIKPYSEMHSWKEQITGPMKNGRGGLAMRRLQVFLKALMKRRTKDILKKEGALNPGGKVKEGEKSAFKIVERKVELVSCKLGVEERRFYNRLATRAQNRLEEMMSGEKQNYIGALVLLLRLRQACNHPELMEYSLKRDKDALTTGSKPPVSQSQATSKSDDLDDLTAMLGGLSVETRQCDVCQIQLSKDESASGTLRCTDCEADLQAHRKKHKKKSKKRHSNKAQAEHTGLGATEDFDEEPVVKSQVKASRQKRVVLDSDDEEEGDWIVPEDQRDLPGLGKAGGTADEDAEGGGDTLGSIDSERSRDESGLSSSKENPFSFVTDDEEEDPAVHRAASGTSQRKHPAKGSDTDEGDDSGETQDEETDAGDGSDSDAESVVAIHGKKMMKIEASSKIKELLRILEKETPSHKVIVFSQFTSMLDLIEPFLKRDNYNFTRYDGGMRNDLREASLDRLRNDKGTRVLLCSLKCGSLGLNLTAASRVVIVEPFWNPFVEEQAIDRVHRLNQTVDVHIYRLTVSQTVEERIIELQEAKRRLAAAAIEGGSKKGVNKLSMNDIMNLFKRDAEWDNRYEDESSNQVQRGVLAGIEHALAYGDEDSEVKESTSPRHREVKVKPREKAKRPEHPVYGRR